MVRNLIVVTDQGTFDVFRELFSSVLDYEESKNYILHANDVFLFEGGTDVSPDMYGEKLGMNSQRPNWARDIHEAMVFKDAQRIGAACIGICRGSQFLTVMSGGKLIQDVTGHTRNHKIHSFILGKTFDVTSTHHQMMFPFNLPEEDYKLVAWANPPLSKRYLNGEDKDVHRPPFEPEIVWYPHQRSLCIQGHPEYMKHNEPFPTYCRELVRKYIFKEA